MANVNATCKNSLFNKWCVCCLCDVKLCNNNNNNNEQTAVTSHVLEQLW